MVPTIKAILLVAVVAFMPATTAWGYDLGNDVVESLQQSPVYIAPGTENVTKDTQEVLTEQLNKDDAIVIVMLPASASGSIDGTMDFAQFIDQSMEGEQIVGLAVGKETIAYSSLLPAGVATDLMTRADSVSTNTTEALISFTRNVHSLQSAHPEYWVAQPIEEPVSADDTSSFVEWLIIGLVVGMICVGAFALLVKSTMRSNLQQIRRPPREIRTLLDEMRALSHTLNDDGLRAVVVQICDDTEMYFARSRSNRQNAESFMRPLTNAKEVLGLCIDMQDNPRAYEQADLLEYQAKALKAMQALSKDVLRVMRDESGQSLATLEGSLWMMEEGYNLP